MTHLVGDLLCLTQDDAPLTLNGGLIQARVGQHISQHTYGTRHILQAEKGQTERVY